jgi:hypothetical protein
VCRRQLFDLRKPPFGDVIACSLGARPVIRGVNASTTTWGRDGPYGRAGLRRANNDPAFHLRRGLADEEPARRQVDITNTQANKFGPPQASEGQDRHDIALVATRRC